jgi:hypothetical protein
VDGNRVFLTQTTSADHGELLAIGTAEAAPTLRGTAANLNGNMFDGFNSRPRARSRTRST